MIVTIHQPEHLPWLGYFNKMAKAERYVILDSVQFEKNYFQNRNRIIGTNGVQWIGVPVCNSGHINNSIAATQIAEDGKWRIKYCNTIRLSYGKHPHYKDVMPLVENAVMQETPFLCDINIAIIKSFAEKLGLHPEFIRSSNLTITGAKSDLILDICKKTGASMYIAGPSGRDYLNVKSFRDAGIDVTFNDFTHPEYPQQKCQKFIPYMSMLDLLMNCGFSVSCDIVMKGNETLSHE